MAKYEVTHVCGHDETHVLYGPYKDRENRLQWLATRNCTKCCRAEQLADARAAAAQQGLPELVGTDKQIAWAMVIRAKALEPINATLRAYSNIGDDLGARMTARAEERQGRALTPQEHDRIQRIVDDHAKIRSIVQQMLAANRAAWWIDNRCNLHVYPRISVNVMRSIVRDFGN